MKETKERELNRLLNDICGSDWHTVSVPGKDIRSDSSGLIFNALFSLQEIQEIQDSFSKSTGVASIITTTDGVPITKPSNFCYLCQHIIRQTDKGLKNCFKSDAAIGRFNAGGPIVQQCLSGGLFDGGASITAGPIHIANWLIGQVRNEATDGARMKKYARNIGADVKAFMNAYEQVPIMSEQQFLDISQTLYLVANQMSQRAFQNLQQARTIAELEKARNIILRSPAASITWRGPESSIVEYITENIVNITGYAADEFSSGQISLMRIVHPEDQQVLKDEFRHHLSGEQVHEYTHSPYRIFSKSGKILWVSSITRVNRANPQHVTYDTLLIDVSERIEDRLQKQDLEKKLQRAQKMELIGTLAGGVAHDLNNILGAIVGYPELLLEHFPPNSEAARITRSIQNSGERAAEIVQDLLTLARRNVISKQVLSLNTLVLNGLETAECRKMLADCAEIHIETYLASPLMCIHGSPAHLTKAIMNLIRNAIESMSKGGSLRITTTNRYVDHQLKGYEDVREGEYVILSIADDGVGIPQEDLEHVFEPFYSKKPLGNSGTGLGMAVVWGTVKDHDGYVTIDSAPNQGTTVRLFFPATRHKEPTGVPTVPMDDYSGNGQRVLIVDDVQIQREVATALITRLNYLVEAASSGEEAVRRLQTEKFDVILLDMVMESGMDGLETFRQIRRINPEARVVITSGFSETFRVQEAQRLGAGPYIRKPYTLFRIGTAIKQMLDA